MHLYLLLRRREKICSTISHVGAITMQLFPEALHQVEEFAGANTALHQ
jgi:hypothetical protein